MWEHWKKKFSFLEFDNGKFLCWTSRTGRAFVREKHMVSHTGLHSGLLWPLDHWLDLVNVKFEMQLQGYSWIADLGIEIWGLNCFLPGHCILLLPEINNQHWLLKNCLSLQRGNKAFGYTLPTKITDMLCSLFFQDCYLLL